MMTRRRFLMQSARSGMAWAAVWPMHGPAFAQNGAQAAPAGGVENQTQNQMPNQAPAAAPPANSNPAVQPNPNLVQQLESAAATERIQTTKLTDTIFLLQGVGGNVVCQIGPDGKLLIDSGIDTGTQHLQDALSRLDAHKLKLLVNTNWHLEHTSGNAALHLAGAFIVAQENTRTRLEHAQYMQVYDLHLPAASDAALPQATFVETETLWVNNDQVDLIHAPDATTDSDIFIHFNKANVIHCGDLWWNGMYPLIDLSSGGTINGTIRGVDAMLAVADDQTKVVPGHGGAGDKDTLQAYRTMLVTVANRVERLKAQGATVQQAVAAKPTADLDAAWGKGTIQPGTFVATVYDSL